MEVGMRTLAGFIVAICLTGTAMTAQGTAHAAQAPVLKVPCRDMGDGRTLIDSAYLPDSAKNARYTIIATQPASLAGKIDRLGPRSHRQHRDWNRRRARRKLAVA
jgi:hypothetical protein